MRYNSLRESIRDTYRKEDADAGKDYIRRWECLLQKYECVELEKMCPKAYQASTRLKNGRESLQNVHCWIEPFGPSFIATAGLIQFLDLLLKKSDNGTRSVTGLEPGGEWVSK